MGRRRGRMFDTSRQSRHDLAKSRPGVTAMPGHPVLRAIQARQVAWQRPLRRIVRHGRGARFTLQKMLFGGTPGRRREPRRHYWPMGIFVNWALFPTRAVHDVRRERRKVMGKTRGSRLHCRHRRLIWRARGPAIGHLAICAAGQKRQNRCLACKAGCRHVIPRSSSKSRAVGTRTGYRLFTGLRA